MDPLGFLRSEADRLVKGAGQFGKGEIGNGIGTWLRFDPTINPLTGQNYNLRSPFAANARAGTGKKEEPGSLTETLVGDPNGGGGGGGGVASTYAAEVARENAQKSKTRGDVKARAAELEAAFEALFGDLGTLVADRTTKARKQGGEKLSEATAAYTGSIPKIDQSYSALGAYDSTNRGDARDEAKAGFEKTTKSINDATEQAVAEIGNFAAKERAGYEADRDAVRRLAGRVDEVDDLGELNEARTNVEDRLGSARAARAGLQTDAGARGTVDSIVGNTTSRFDSAMDALDQVTKSALAGTPTGAAAVKAIIDGAGLTDEEKVKAQARYGNTYAEQAAL